MNLIPVRVQPVEAVAKQTEKAEPKVPNNPPSCCLCPPAHQQFSTPLAAAGGMNQPVQKNTLYVGKCIDSFRHLPLLGLAEHALSSLLGRARRLLDEIPHRGTPGGHGRTSYFPGRPRGEFALRVS